MRIQTDDIHPVVVQAWKNGPYLVPNTLLMPGDASLYIMNDSNSHIQLKDDMVVAVGQEALHIEEESESVGIVNLGKTSQTVPFIWKESLEWREKMTHC